MTTKSTPHWPCSPSTTRPTGGTGSRPRLRHTEFWLVREYIPEIADLELSRPSAHDTANELSADSVVPLPWDFTDGVSPPISGPSTSTEEFGLCLVRCTTRPQVDSNVDLGFCGQRQPSVIILVVHFGMVGAPWVLPDGKVADEQDQ